MLAALGAMLPETTAPRFTIFACTIHTQFDNEVEVGAIVGRA